MVYGMRCYGMRCDESQDAVKNRPSTIDDNGTSLARTGVRFLLPIRMPTLTLSSPSRGGRGHVRQDANRILR